MQWTAWDPGDEPIHPSLGTGNVVSGETEDLPEFLKAHPASGDPSVHIHSISPVTTQRRNRLRSVSTPGPALATRDTSCEGGAVPPAAVFAAMTCWVIAVGGADVVFAAALAVALSMRLATRMRRGQQ